jgi:hypothetical protein
MPPCATVNGGSAQHSERRGKRREDHGNHWRKSPSFVKRWQKVTQTIAWRRMAGVAGLEPGSCAMRFRPKKAQITHI